MANCEEIGGLLDAYALGAVEPQDVGPIEEHLAECLAESLGLMEPEA